MSNFNSLEICNLGPDLMEELEAIERRKENVNGEKVNEVSKKRWVVNIYEGSYLSVIKNRTK